MYVCEVYWEIVCGWRWGGGPPASYSPLGAEGWRVVVKVREVGAVQRIQSWTAGQHWDWRATSTSLIVL